MLWLPRCRNTPQMPHSATEPVRSPSGTCPYSPGNKNQGSHPGWKFRYIQESPGGNHKPPTTLHYNQCPLSLSQRALPNKIPRSLSHWIPFLSGSHMPSLHRYDKDHYISFPKIRSAVLLPLPADPSERTAIFSFPDTISQEQQEMQDTRQRG